MALKNGIKLINNFGEESIFPNALIKVSSISGSKTTIEANIDYFKETGMFLQRTTVSFIPNMNENFIKQTYEYLKTLDEFKDSEDC